MPLRQNLSALCRLAGLSLLICTGAVQGSCCAGCPPQYDVAIIGAGLSGLSTARQLSAANVSVVVLEARNRVGGKVENFYLHNGGVTELGAAFVGPTQDHVVALIKDLGLQTFLEYNTGFNVDISQGNRTTYAGAVPQVSSAVLQQLGQTLSSLDSMAAELDVNAPWEHPQAATWDSMTLATFLSNVTTLPQALNIVTSAVNSIFSAEPGELSLLYTVAYIAAAGNETSTGNLFRLISTDGGAQESRIVGGTGLIAPAMAAALPSSVNLILNAPVHHIGRPVGSTTYTIYAQHHTVTATQVVVAMPPPLAARMSYDPPLPAMRDQLTQRFALGAIGKAIAIYPTPFWRHANLTGQAVSDTGTTRVTFDVSPPDASYGAMLGFIDGDQMRALDNSTDDEITALVTEDFVKYFGDGARNATQWVVKRWDNDIWSRGAPVAFAGPGGLSKYGPALRAPFGGVHFAGTETSVYWTGYMDGAIRSGERVAAEVLEALKGG